MGYIRQGTRRSSHYAVTTTQGEQPSITPVAGALHHRLSGRLAHILGGLLVTIGYVGRALLSHRLALWQLIVLITTTGFGFGLINIATVISLKDAFGESFPTVFSVSLMTANIGIAVLPVVLDYLVESLGYKIGMLAFSGLTVSLIVSGLLSPAAKATDQAVTSHETDELLEEPQSIVDEEMDQTGSDGGQVQVAEMEAVRHEYSDTDTKGFCSTVIEVLTKHKALVLALLLDAGYGYSMSSWSILLVPYCASVGFDSKTAVWLSSFGGIGGLLGRCFCVVLYHKGKMNAFLGLIFPGLLAAIGYISTLFFDNFALFSVMAFTSGFSLSVQDCFDSGMIALVVCDHHFRVAIVLQYIVAGVFEQVGGLVSGAGADLTGTPRLSFGALAVVALLQTVIAIPWSFHKFEKKKCDKSTL